MAIFKTIFTSTRVAISLLAAMLILSTQAVNAANKPNLVLLPIEVSQQVVDLGSEYGSALQEGLQNRYTVFYGAAVEKELEKEYSKIDCDPETCNQNIAIAFNGELIADSSVKKIEGGYLLKLVIRNVLTSEVVETQTVPCRGCDSFSVIDQLKQMGSGATDSRKTKITSSGNTSSDAVTNTDQHAILIFDTDPTGAVISINGKAVGFSPYQGLNHKVGEKIKAIITLRNYRPYEVTLDLRQAITQLKPIVLERGQGQVLIASNPFKADATVYVNGLAKGKAPLMLTLLAGKQSIQIKTASESTKVEILDVIDRDNRKYVLDFIERDNEKNKILFVKYTKEIEELDKQISKANVKIHKNEEGMSQFPEMADSFSRSISALSKIKEKLVKQRKGFHRKIKDLERGNAKQSLSFSNSLEKLIEKAKKGSVFAVSAVVTCPFAEIYGKHEGDISACYRLAVKKAKNIAAEKFSPVDTIQEDYSIEVTVLKEDKDGSYYKTNNNAERVEAQFKGEIRVRQVFKK